MTATDNMMRLLLEGERVGTGNTTCVHINKRQLAAQNRESLVDPAILRHRFDYNHMSGKFWHINSPSRRYNGLIAGTRHGKGYRVLSLDGVRFLAHRVAWAHYYGEWPKLEIDHINQCKSDNRIANLRAVDGFKNHQNMPIPKDNKSGVVGVCFQTSKNRWVAEIKAHGVKKYLLQTDNLFEAACARKSAEIHLGFHPNHGLSRI